MARRPVSIVYRGSMLPMVHNERTIDEILPCMAELGYRVATQERIHTSLPRFSRAGRLCGGRKRVNVQNQCGVAMMVPKQS